MLWDIFKKKSKLNPSTNSSKENRDTNSNVEEKAIINNQLDISLSTNPGCIRTNNEDNFFVSAIGCKPDSCFTIDLTIDIDRFCIFSIFDGMGGESYGDEASRIAAETLKEYCSELNINKIKKESIKSIIEQYISVANKRILDMISKYKCNRSGCTMALIVLFDGMVYAFSIGDSRIYRKFEDSFVQISEDQTLAIKKLKANIYTEDEARNSPDAHKITSYIGLDDRGKGVPYLSYPPFSLSNSVILLCSDGLTDMCNDDEIHTIISKEKKSPANALLNLAMKNGGEDNITCLVIQKIQ